ncbi:MAG: DUF3842 family protein [Clostridiales bacterium]|nr:DUF3842 family protein [Clostridiales bacterium]
MNVLIIDGQGGKIGKLLIEGIKVAGIAAEITAVGTNSIATSTMLKAGADNAATGENAVAVNCRRADVIIGPVGIVIADSLYGEVSPAMAIAVGQSSAQKMLLPVNQCSSYVAGVPDLTFGSLVSDIIAQLKKWIETQ